MPKILYIITTSVSLRFLEGQIAFVRANGFDVAIVSSPDEALTNFGRAQNVRVYGVPMARAITPVADLKSIAGICDVIRKEKPDIVNVSTPKASLVGMTAARLMNVRRRLYLQRGLPLDTAKGKARAIFWSTEKLTASLATHMVSVSPGLMRKSIALRIVPAQKIRVLAGGSGNGVESVKRFRPDRFSSDEKLEFRRKAGIPDDAYVLGFIGRIVADKGIETLVEAWRKIREEHPNSWLVIAGPEEERDPIPRHVVDALKSDPRVKLLGQVEKAEETYALFDVMIFPSRREGLPNVVLEAQAMGLPLIASDIPGCIDATIPGVTAHIVPVLDAEAYVKAARLLASEEARRAMGGAGRAHVIKSFSREAIWQALVDLYREMLASKGRC